MGRLGCVLILFVLMIACKSRFRPDPPSPTSESDKSEPIYDFFFSLQRTVCFGQCPAYRIEVHGDGRLLWYGEHFVSRIGTYSRTLTSDELQKLQLRLEAAQLEQLQPVYDDPGISDLPSTILKYAAKGKQYQITCRFRCPNALQALFRELELLADTTGMVPYKPAKPIPTD